MFFLKEKRVIAKGWVFFFLVFFHFKAIPSSSAGRSVQNHAIHPYTGPLSTLANFFITINTIYIGTNIVMHRVMKPSSVSVHGF